MQGTLRRIELCFKKKFAFDDELRKWENAWTKEKEEKYLKEFGGNEQWVAVMRAESEQNWIPDARLTHALFLIEMEEAGIRFNMNDLDPFEWKLLAEYKLALKEFQNKKLESRIRR